MPFPGVMLHAVIGGHGEIVGGENIFAYSETSLICVQMKVVGASRAGCRRGRPTWQNGAPVQTRGVFAHRPSDLRTQKN